MREMPNGLKALINKHEQELEVERAAHRDALALCAFYEARIAELEAIIAYIDLHAPLADKTSIEPGITLSEAARRAIADEAGHSA